RIGAAQSGQKAAEELAAAQKEAAESEAFFHKLRQASERSNLVMPGRLSAAIKDLKSAAERAPARKQAVALRTGIAEAVSAPDVELMSLLVKDFPTDCVLYHPNGKMLALGRRKANADAFMSVRLIAVPGGELVRELAVPASDLSYLQK